MTAHELSQNINALLVAISRQTYLKEVLDDMSLSFSKVVEWLITLMDSGANPQNEHARVSSNISGQAGIFRGISARRLFRDLDALDAALEKHGPMLTSVDPGRALPLRSLLDAFAAHFEHLIQEPSVPATLRTLLAAREVSATLNTLRFSLEVISERLAVPDVHGSPNEAALTLLLKPNDEVRVFVAKVRSLELVYEEICRLLSVSTAEYPLEIAKIESGSSLWAILFGESKVITLAVDLIKEAIGYRYRNFTREGQLGSIPRRVDELGAVLNLESRMSDLGYDTANMRESIQKSSAVIAKELNTLLAGETEVIVNGELFSLTSVVDKLIAENRETLLLKDGTENTGEVPVDGGEATEPWSPNEPTDIGEPAATDDSLDPESGNGST